MQVDETHFAEINPCSTVPWPEARSELQRLRSDPRFRCTERNWRFLEFIAEELYQGRQERIKAYVIAVDVFGRPSTFDPATDPIVRIEAARLRASLAQYYEAYGMQHDVHVELPKGRYVPIFKKAAADVMPRAVDIRPTSLQSSPVSVNRWSEARPPWAWLVVPATATVAVFAILIAKLS